MPIAHCIVSRECRACNDDVVDLWAKESGISRDEMTINVLIGDQQYGKNYSIMATLYLPSVWSPPNRSSLQVGLAKALAKHFDQPVEQVHIITSIVEAGLVVEAGREQF